MTTDRPHLAPISPTMMRLIAPGHFVLRPQLLTRLEAWLWAGRSRRSLSALQRPRANTEAVPPKREQENILPHHLWHAAFTRQHFQINSPYGRPGRYPPQGRWEAYVENFQYHEKLGCNGVL
jgi:hypothetical protein